MRTLVADLTTTQKRTSLSPLVKIVLTQGVNSYTYTQTRIMRITHIEEPYNQVADVVLNNGDKTLTSLDFKGYKGVISWGMTDINGVDRFSDCAPLWVIGSQFNSWMGGLTLTLSLAGTPNRLTEDRARDPFMPTSDDIRTMKDFLTEVAKGVLPNWATSTAYSADDLVIPEAATYTSYIYKCTTAGTSGSSAPTWPTTIGNTVADNTAVWTCVGKELYVYSLTPSYTITFDSEDALLDSFKPADSFSIGLNQSRLSVIQWLLSWTKCSFRVEDDDAIHIFQPTISGTTFDYEYSLVTGEHLFFSKALRNRIVIPNYVVVTATGTTFYSGFAEDTESSDLLEIREYHRLPITSDAQADAIASAQLEKYKLDADMGAGNVPVNVGQEVYDYVKITDDRENDNRVGNILYIKRTFNPRTSAPSERWGMEIRFGKGMGGNLMGTSLPGTTPGTTEEDSMSSLVKQLNLKFQEIWDAIFSKELDRLHVTNRLRIPVGTDMFDREP